MYKICIKIADEMLLYKIFFEKKKRIIIVLFLSHYSEEVRLTHTQGYLYS